MALSLIINKDFNLYNVPDLADTRLMSNLLIDLGIKINWKKGNLNFSGEPKKDEASDDLVRQMRALICLTKSSDASSFFGSPEKFKFPFFQFILIPKSINKLDINLVSAKSGTL